MEPDGETYEPVIVAVKMGNDVRKLRGDRESRSSEPTTALYSGSCCTWLREDF
jgi:hypothetical protein